MCYNYGWPVSKNKTGNLIAEIPRESFCNLFLFVSQKLLDVFPANLMRTAAGVGVAVIVAVLTVC